MNLSSVNQHRFYLDIPLLLLILLLMSVSLTILYSMGGLEVMLNQAARFGVGFVVMLTILLIPKNFIRFFSPSFYLLTLILLLAVHFFGVTINNSQRWLNIGIAQIQPSEIAKISIPLMLAYYYYNKPLPPKLKDIGLSLLIIMVPTLFVLKQPDLGTAILVASSGFVLLFFAGISWRLIFAAIIAVIIAAPVYWAKGMEAYQKKTGIDGF